MGTRIWTVTVSERTRSEQLVSQHDGLKPELRGPIMAGHGVKPNFDSHSDLFSHPKFYWEHFTSDVWSPWQTVALKLHDSCPNSPQNSYDPDWNSPVSELFVSQPSAKEHCFCSRCDKLCIYTLLKLDFFFHARVHYLVFVITVNQCFNHYLYITAY